MPGILDPYRGVLDAWDTANRTTIFLVEHLPVDVLDLRVPGVPTRTVRMIAAHIHNARRNWLGVLGIERPPRVDERHVTRRQLAAALRQSGRGMTHLLERGIANGGCVPATKRYVWRNLPLDIFHVLVYFTSHEAHHRGQIVLAARQAGHRLPVEVTGGLWQFSTRVRERVRGSRSAGTSRGPVPR